VPDVHVRLDDASLDAELEALVSSFTATAAPRAA
jgi:hypothetical protein